MRFKRVLAVGLVWVGILIVGVIGVELYARYTQGYLLWHWSLRPVTYAVNLDRLKIWNRKFYEQHRDHFAQWPIQLEFFDADSPTPQYLFKPNLRMTDHNGRFVPAAPGERVVWSSNSCTSSSTKRSACMRRKNRSIRRGRRWFRCWNRSRNT